MRACRAWLILTGLVCGSVWASAGDYEPFRAVLTDQNTALSLDQKPVEAWLDLPKGVSPETVLRLPPAARLGTSFGYRKDPVWLRIPIRSESKELDWDLMVYPRTLQSIDYFLFSDAGALLEKRSYQIGRTGEKGSLDTLTPGFPLSVHPGFSGTLLLKVQGYEQLGLDIRFLHVHDNFRQDRRIDLSLGIYVGVLAALLFYTALIYRTLREPFFPPYLLFMGSMLILVPSLNGLPDFLLDKSFLFTDLIPLATALTCLSGNEFCRRFLSLASHSPRLDRLQRRVVQVAAGASVLSLPPIYHWQPALVGQVNDSLLVSTSLLMLIAGAVSLQAGVRSARYFMVAWLGFLSSCLIFLLSTYGWIPNNGFTRSVVEIGNTLEMLILAVAISDRVREIELERIAALKTALQAERLESLVRMVCHDLSNSMSVVSTHAALAKRGYPASWEAVSRAVQEQGRIVDFVRNHTSLHTNSTEPGLSPVAITDVMATLQFLFEGRARSKGLALQWPESDALKGLRVWAEESTLIHSVLGNALSNAIKFSNPGATIEVRVRQEAAYILVEIEDPGVGMTRESQRKLELSTRAVSRPGTHGEPGSGFGIGLARYFMKIYRGELSWRSQSQEDGFDKTGTIMSFRLKKVVEEDLSDASEGEKLDA